MLVNTIFDVPCPDCSGRLAPGEAGGLQCSACGQAYESRMGHLFPVAERRTTTIASPAARPGSPVTPVRS